MLNTHQRKTESGKPLVDKVLKTPLFNLPIHIRLKLAKRALGLGASQSSDDRWDSIKYDVGRLQCI